MSTSHHFYFRNSMQTCLRRQIRRTASCLSTFLRWRSVRNQTGKSTECTRYRNRYRHLGNGGCVCGSIFFSITLTFQLTNLQLPTNFQPQRWWVWTFRLYNPLGQGSKDPKSRTLLIDHRVPPNLCFIIDDVNQEFRFPFDTFDFIHVRGLAGSKEHWPSFLRQCYEYVFMNTTILRDILTVDQSSQARWAF